MFELMFSEQTIAAFLTGLTLWAAAWMTWKGIKNEG